MKIAKIQTVEFCFFPSSNACLLHNLARQKSIIASGHSNEREREGGVESGALFL